MLCDSHSSHLSEQGMTPLIAAVQRGHIPAMASLLRDGASVNCATIEVVHALCFSVF